MMPSPRLFPTLVCLGIVAALSGCGRGKADHVLVRESFNSDNTYSRSVDVTPAQACEAARRVLLSQGYLVARADAAMVEGSKNFQPNEDTHEQLDLRVSCVAQGDSQAWVFVSAVQDRYALKKSPTSASVGVGVLGSVSLPVGSSNDSMVRVASVTVQDAGFYKNFFERMNQYLPKSAPKSSDSPAAQAPPPPPPNATLTPAATATPEPAAQSPAPPPQDVPASSPAPAPTPATEQPAPAPVTTPPQTPLP